MKFYVINNRLFDDSTSAYGEDFGDILFGPARKCEVCGSTITGLKWLPPFQIKVSRSRLGDFVFGTFDNFIVSSRVKTFVEDEGIKGIRSFEPVTIFFRNKVLSEKYYYPDIVMSDAKIDLDRSGFEFDGPSRCPACQKGGSIIEKWDGLVFEDPGTIEFDVFTTRVLPGTVVVSQRFRDFVTRHSFSNISMLDASKFGKTWAASKERGNL